MVVALDNALQRPLLAVAETQTAWSWPTAAAPFACPAARRRSAPSPEHTVLSSTKLLGCSKTATALSGRCSPSAEPDSGPNHRTANPRGSSSTSLRVFLRGPPGLVLADLELSQLTRAATVKQTDSLTSTPFAIPTVAQVYWMLCSGPFPSPKCTSFDESEQEEQPG
jgi:hypothetical protein